jgi:hypothetical protein
LCLIFSFGDRRLNGLRDDLFRIGERDLLSDRRCFAGGERDILFELEFLSAKLFAATNLTKI